MNGNGKQILWKILKVQTEVMMNEKLFLSVIKILDRDVRL